MTIDNHASTIDKCQDAVRFDLIESGTVETVPVCSNQPLFQPASRIGLSHFCLVAK